jgi:Predicted acetyltransferase
MNFNSKWKEGLTKMYVELKQLSMNDGYNIYQMLQEIPKDENGYINTVNGMTFDEYKEWLIRDNWLSKSKEIIDGWKVPSSTYWLYIHEKPVGVGKIRHFLTEKLREEGGHIGYSIRPSERNKGYGRILLKNLLYEASNIGIEDALLTIRNENEYSLKTALANGGIIENRNDIRSYVWIKCISAN